LSIAFSLAAVLFVFLVLGDEYPRLDHEFGPLVRNLILFTAMTAICTASFYSLVKEHRLRWAAQAVMWLGMLGTGYYYWP